MKTNRMKTKNLIIKILVLMLCTLSVLSFMMPKTNEVKAVEAKAFYAENFDGSSPLQTSGDATIQGGDIYITHAETWQAGSVFSRDKIYETNGFSTYFCLSTSDSSHTPADGFCIILARDTNVVDYSSLQGQNLGYGNIGASIGIEIDMFHNDEPEIPHSYLWSRSGSTESEDGTHSESGTVHLDSSMVMNGDFYVWIEYSNVTHRINLYFSKTTTKPNSPTGTYYIDLGQIVGSSYYIGISASTGACYQNHIVKKWGWTNTDTFALSSTLTVNPNGGTWQGSKSTQKFTIDIKSQKYIPIPTRQGYVFKGWTLVGSDSTMTSLTTNATFTMGQKAATLTANWQPNSAKITLNKTDSITGESLNGATFGLYEWNGSTYVRKSTLTDNGNGTYNTPIIQYSDTNLGKYRIIEESAPTYYTNARATRDILIAESGYHEYTYSWTNVPNRVRVQAIKTDAETGNRISGATFTIYEWNKNIGQYEVYARDVALDFQTDRSYLSDWLYSNRKNEGKFRIVETTAPDGYYGDFVNGNKVVNDITITQGLDGQTITIQNKGGLYTNTRVKGTINVNKIDIETNRSLAQGDATLDGAVYELYAAEDIYHKDTVTGKIYNKDQLIQSQTIKNGQLIFDNIEIGRYYIKEKTPPVGYLLNNEIYEVNMNYEGETVAHLTRNVTVREQVKKQAFRLQKVSLNDQETEATPLQNAGFKIYLIKDLQGVKEGIIKADSNGKYDGIDFVGYDFNKEGTAIDYSSNQNGERIPELFTDINGQITSPELAYGQYVVIESTVPEDMAVIRPFIVTIEEDSRTPQKQRYFIDKEFESLIKVIKKDKQTGETIINKNAKYRIWSITENKYIEQVVSYPTGITYGTEENPYQINEKGEFITPTRLAMGEYELREVSAPEGYILTGYEGRMYEGVYTEKRQSRVRFSITTNTVYYEDPDAKDVIINVEQYNDEMLGELEITKTGEQLSNIVTNEDGTIETIYREAPIEGAEFEIYAAEDIYTQDNQGYKICSKDGLIKKITTNAEGKAYVDNLPIGKYYVKEVKAGEGFKLNEEIKEFEISYQGEKTAVQKVEMSYKNERQKVNINGKEGLEIEKIADKTVYKSGEEIEYTIKVANTTENIIQDIKVEETILNGEFENISTDNIKKTGNRTVTIKELKAGESAQLKFKLKTKSLENLSKTTKETLETEKVKVVNNVKATGKMIEMDTENPSATKTTEIEGTGQEEVYVSNKELVIVKEALKNEYELGEKAQYIIKVINNSQSEIKNVKVEEKLLNGNFIDINELNKNGREVTQIGQTVRINKIEAGETIVLRYEYTISTDTQVVLDKNNKILLNNIVTTIGEKEEVDPNDQSKTEIKEITDENSEQIEIQTKETTDKLGIIKKDLETGERIEGAVIGLYAGEDIKGIEGNILIKAGTLIQTATTDKQGRAKYTIDLPIGKYYIKEIEAPNGYKLSEEILEINTKNKGQEIGDIGVEKILVNRSTQAKIEKKDTKGNLIKGAKLQIIDEQGKVIDTWETSKAVYRAGKLEAEKIYTLKEIEPAPGYVTAEHIKFKIDADENLYYVKAEKNDGLEIKEYTNTEKIEMVDEKTQIKIEIKDKESSELLPGMIVQIKDKETGEIIHEYKTGNTPQTIKGIPIGKYEIISKDPKNSGYVTSKTEITVEDTKKEQKIEIEQEKTKIKIELKNEETKELVKEGKFAIIDKNGKEIKTVETIEGITEIEGLPYGEYTIHQIEGPKGYYTSEDIKIEVKDTEQEQTFEIPNKKKTFNLSINKILKTQIINGVGAEVKTGTSKIEIEPKKVGKTDIKLIYEITVKNEGELEGKAKIKEEIPKGLEMKGQENLGWTISGETATITTETILPGQSQTYEVTLNWKNTITNIGTKENKASIEATENEAGFEDEENTDNTSTATLLILIKTGEETPILLMIVISIILLLAITIIIAIKFIKV